MTMPVATKTNYENCPEGDDILVRLSNVEVILNDENAQYHKGEERWRWVFETLEQTNSDDEPFKVSLFTGTSYIPGSQQCKLTKLLDKLCRDLSTEEKQEFDTDTLVGKKFRIDVSHQKTQAGRTRANIDNIKRVASAAAAPKAKAKPVVEEDDDDDDGDPFAKD